MSTTLILPTLGRTDQEATILFWLKREGDRIEPGDLVVEIETEKAVLQVEALVGGTITKILVHEGETAPIGAALAMVED
jgi:pyruvate dehydrogenase E2 component (dihydrolipoamide acetyltransferase)